MAITTDRTDDEIRELGERVMDAVDMNRTKFPGQTYEQGVENALRFINGDIDMDEVYELE